MVSRTADAADSNSRIKPRWILAAIGVVAMLVGGAGFADWWTCLPADAAPSYVGRQSCIQCHQQEVKLWEGSHHDLAMDLATEETVLADFDGAKLEHYGVTSRMFRRDGKFMINTEGPDGAMTDFEIKYVFGVDPLQQYMVEFDRHERVPANEISRLQVLRVSWDTEQQKWFYLRPPDVDEKLAPEDDLHWTGIAQRWNNMCADCHSTNLKKRFDTKTRTYHTTYSEIDVSCEACHGPASLHVEIARTKGLFWDRNHGYGLAKLKNKQSPKAQLDTCFQCHSRRRIVKPDFRPGDEFYDHFANELLLEHTYHADGQILDEVYVHGSFIQSKMYHKNIRCTDCHDPHTARLKHEGNKVCTSCHQHSAGKYDTPIHHHHKPDGKGASCVECHMPETTYMAVDERRDHSLRVPRPDLSAMLGTPNACTRCHLDRAKLPEEKKRDFTQYLDWMLASRGDATVQSAVAEIDNWAAKHFAEWYGEKKDTKNHYAQVLADARESKPGMEEKLAAAAYDQQLPGILRATCVYELGQYAPDFVVETSEPLLNDDDIQVRVAAVANMQLASEQVLIKRLVPLLEDSARVVRTEAARVLSQVRQSSFDGAQRRLLRSALKEFEEGVLVNNDRAAAHLTLGVLHESLGDTKSAQRCYENAIRVEPFVTGPRTNLAALLERLAEESQAQAQRLIQTNRQAAIDSSMTAQKLRGRVVALRKEELPLLGRDAGLAPENAAIQYRYGLSLYLHGRHEDAEKALKCAVELEPNTPDFVLGLALLHRQQKRFDEALEQIDRLLDLRPADRTYQQLRSEVRQESMAASIGE